jgi:hypothetical protein
MENQSMQTFFLMKKPHKFHGVMMIKCFFNYGK